MHAIGGIGANPNVESLEPATRPEPTTGSIGAEDASTRISFENVLGDLVQRANGLDAVAAEKSAALASGASDDVHGTMIANKEAEISVKLVGSIRNKLLDAFHEIWRTGV